MGTHNERLYSEQFVTKTVNDELKGKLNKLAHDVKELNQKAGIPCVLYLLRFAVAFTWIFTLLGRLMEFIFNNLDFYVFVNDGGLCFYDLRKVWEIPLSSLKYATFEKKKKSFESWNKKEPYNSEKYKKFKINKGKYDYYFLRIYKVEINDIRGEYHLIIPEYDWETFNSLTQYF